MATEGGDLNQNKYTITFWAHFQKKNIFFRFFTYTSSVYMYVCMYVYMRV